MSTTTRETLSDLERRQVEAEARSRSVAAEIERTQQAAEQERRARRVQVWRTHLAEIEGHDYAGTIRQAKADVVAAVRGESDLDPWTAAYRLMTAEQAAERDHAYANDLRTNLGLPTSPTPPGQRSFSDPAAYLAQVVEAEAGRTAQAVQERRRAEVLAAWNGEDLPPVPVRLDPSRHRWFQDQVGQVERSIAQAEIQERDAKPIVVDGSDPHARAVHERTRKQDREHLEGLRRTLAQAQRDLAAFEAGRIT